MSDPILHVIHGSPTAEELALLTAVVAAASGGEPDERPAVRRGGWNDPGALHRRQLYVGPNGWRAAARPG
jgi:Acyl-CoA carboxylase epsilon subunit